MPIGMVSGTEIRVDVAVGGQTGDTQASGWTRDTVLWSHGVEPSGWLDVGLGYKFGANQKGAS